MKKATKLCALVLAVCMAAVMLTACGSAPASTASGASAGGEADGQVVVNLAKDVAPESMDPINAEDGFSMELIGATMSGLYTLDADDNLVPDLATECTVSEDGMTYTFKLREDAKWSNGDALTAHDFVFAWKRLADPAVAGAYAWMLDEVLSVKNAAEIATGELPVDELGVSAPDDYTFEVQLTRPVPYFEHAMVFTPFFPLNEKFVTEQGDSFALTVDGLLFSGPYKMTEWDVGGTRMVLEKNENYYKPTASKPMSSTTKSLPTRSRQ